MPKQRDVRAQRELLSNATWQVLADNGLPGLTLRAVAERAGCTTGLVMHAFPTKKALLLHARDLLYARTAVRADAAEAACADAPGALAAVLGQAVDLPHGHHEESRVWVGFLAAALADDDLAERHRAANRSFLARIHRLVAACRPEWTDERLELTTKSLVALVEGMNVLAAADPKTYPARLQQAALAEALAGITPPGRNGGGRHSG
ncbi:TetR family transcriptional regulator [Amycolatopsis mediterranei S699]|uniref:TetR family transcriptional regulator n=2 Tax=Amycolatopsis mediterranei TaxID=33910 RepID=A0A0H3DEL9_AMYMU|nr:TetR/AcrR family transcriptional regulator [Amycolatopsis mediterranei]ADJ49360.1 TetR family transcriptional regulator [Amycolatopsis mediterranei U32]AEK46330.1 TetR family transcriptional regulator [Amycolatopsis mediterranei S699]AFO81067.1 TetR family transcriptional regulator [Amycolatopsis mediterranei S699]AGT88195.1 TetR family transcriptional regulator [Amycolatopsis mediterranei RB]KDO09481.1 TetR family transcriptional regulator [Amycolatopsis mediterranei]